MYRQTRRVYTAEYYDEPSKHGIGHRKYETHGAELVVVGRLWTPLMMRIVEGDGDEAWTENNIIIIALMNELLNNYVCHLKFNGN